MTVKDIGVLGAVPRSDQELLCCRTITSYLPQREVAGLIPSPSFTIS